MDRWYHCEIRNQLISRYIPLPRGIRHIPTFLIPESYLHFHTFDTESDCWAEAPQRRNKTVLSGLISHRTLMGPNSNRMHSRAVPSCRSIRFSFCRQDESRWMWMWIKSNRNDLSLELPCFPSWLPTCFISYPYTCNNSVPNKPRWKSLEWVGRRTDPLII